MSTDSCFIRFTSKIDGIELPDKFDYPFYYDPTPLALIAANELKDYLKNQEDWVHNFGIDPEINSLVIGKMFGVLVVKNEQGELGYLRAFSGKLAGGNHHDKFVPPVFDMLKEDGFYKKEEAIVNAFNAEILAFETDPLFLNIKEELQVLKKQAQESIAQTKIDIKQAKLERKKQRAESISMNQEDVHSLLKNLSNLSVREQFELKDQQKYWHYHITSLENKINVYDEKLNALKLERKNKSGKIQAQLFEQYLFYNQNLESKSLGSIFSETPFQQPPAGAGECAAPKLLQYAFQHKLTPITIAEFWWGDAPKSEIRAHEQFYPACKGKCEPILAHMLKGIEINENTLLQNPGLGKSLEIIYEDEAIAIINKPFEFLSVPGKNIKDSVAERMKTLYPEATGPLVVHRLDMSTSGLMLIAKTLAVHKVLQRQFIKRKIEKEYEALLEGELKTKNGNINLPLRLDIDDRPRQLVCFEHGKLAQTEWELLEIKNGNSKVRFKPLTGRTHQLRVHAAHPLGLNMPIIGDDLYGKKEKRLYLHAAKLSFYHPINRQWLTFELKADF